MRLQLIIEPWTDSLKHSKSHLFLLAHLNTGEKTGVPGENKLQSHRLKPHPAHFLNTQYNT